MSTELKCIDVVPRSKEQNVYLLTTAFVGVYAVAFKLHCQAHIYNIGTSSQLVLLDIVEHDILLKSTTRNGYNYMQY